MSSDMNITAAIGMSSEDPRHRQVLQQTWSSVSHLVNVSGEEASFSAFRHVFKRSHSKGSIKPRQRNSRCPSLMSTKRVALSAVSV